MLFWGRDGGEKLSKKRKVKGTQFPGGGYRGQSPLT